MFDNYLYPVGWSSYTLDEAYLTILQLELQEISKFVQLLLHANLL